jgi:hypothetical protein
MWLVMGDRTRADEITNAETQRNIGKGNMWNKISKAIVDLPGKYSTEQTTGDVKAIKLFTPDADATWVLWEYDPEYNQCFGMCDLGLGFPELGSVDVAELHALRGKFGLPIEMDLYGTDTRSAWYRQQKWDLPPEWEPKEDTDG